MLEELRSPLDLRALTEEELASLADEIREVLIRVVSSQGGHLASNLGAVELTIALHCVFEAPEDKILFDVGHQAYVHKLLTGRYRQFSTLRQKGGLSGFPRVQESRYDAFGVGHASTAISAALGMARAYRLRGEKRHVVAVVGDGALTGGMCYEALNDAGGSLVPLIVVLNDNTMSISPNVGALSGYLTHLRQSGVYRSMKRALRNTLQHVPLVGAPLLRLMEWMRDAVKTALINGKFFEALGLEYYGPIDGHDIARMRETFERAKQAEGPVLIHVVTQKGKGYIPAEDRPDKFHGVAPFYVEPTSGTADSGKLAAAHLIERARADQRIAVITAAMPDGTGMSAFAKAHPRRFFDVGIAEEHAVTMASGMALAGMRPFVCIYSTFLQRAYDQIMMDACLNRAPVVFLLDRSGLTGPDGETHQGIFDLAYLRQMPGLAVASPRDEGDLYRLIEVALSLSGPMAIRYSKECVAGGADRPPLRLGEWEELRAGSDVAVLALGRMVAAALAAAELLEGRGVSCAVVDARFVKPLDEAMLAHMADAPALLVTLEDNVTSGGFGSAVQEWLCAREKAASVFMLGVPDEFIPQASVQQQLEMLGLTPRAIANAIYARWRETCASTNDW
ncbi:MAG TPA: 1-deoxy-D-xylulose-5-phosphate synthase [Candidatus Alectryocaccomicrobium excrementavium]|uniref:1-deoxy-D-xylulose-5-phosphate synthase n=1 Tax=Candidatus Alectryocaccomicrobium excrementavium TaxID=2840668 RepID=A0A9D1FY70_9FIRM|nr:1-deoxy-D-xylulose-5-phosphate synthase [Candidatus Alectryocaccomicrobium excrementavium]